MKKALSVLLVAAAIFGFYGSAVSVNDILACKDYWEEAGEKSTADMNKLEDGLNQLKENEQAYLDGKKQVEDGEVALADAEQQLADGEAKLASGRAELAQGEADYAAAPAKLAAGEKDYAKGKADLDAGKAQVAKGEEDLAKGEEDLAKGEKDLAKGEKDAADGIKGINTVIGYLKQVKTAYKDYSTDEKTGKKGPSFKAGYKQIEDGRNKILAMVSDSDTSKLLAMLKTVSKNENLGKNFNKEASYKDFNDSVVDAIATFKAVSAKLGKAKKLADNYKDNAALAGAATLLKIPEKIEDPDNPGSEIDNPSYPKTKGTHAQLREGVAQTLGSLDTSALADLKAVDEDQYNSLTAAITALSTNSSSLSDADYAQCIEKLQSGLGDLSTMLGGYITKLDGLSASASDNPEGLQAWSDGYEQIVGSQEKLNDSLKQIYSGILGNTTLKKAFEKNANALYKYMNGFKAGVLYGNLGTEDLPDFIEDMDTITGNYNPSIIKALQSVKQAIKDDLQAGRDKVQAGREALQAGREALQAGKDQVAAGEIALAEGKAKLDKGYADYAAAPAKLAAGRQQLAEGEATLADGYKQYEEGKQALADGKAQLAQYEDGEQQVRDGLATLFNTEADLDLVSIADRLDGDGDFDNGDKHLELDEGLEAVDVGRGYQADDGVLITKEIMGRAIGTGGLLAAGVLAVIAAILSFLKKNKGAGVFAILAAAAGVFGIAYGTQAGTYFSSIAGSAVGATGWIAAGILGAVALVHAIVHFASPKNA